MSETLTREWTYDEYIKLNDGKRYEIIMGKLVMNAAPSPKHQIIIRNLSFLLFDYIKKNNLGEILFAPCDVILDKNNVVQPDILFISKDKENIIQKSKINGTPDLVIEIISPSSLKRDNEDKRIIYQKFGIKEYWLVFPSDETIEVLELVERTYRVFDYASTEDTEKEPKVISKVLNGFTAELKDIF